MALANRLPTESRPWVEDWTIEAPDAHSSSTSTTARLAKECIAVSRRVLQRVKAHPDVSQATYHALEKSHSSLALWEAGYGVGEGKLDELLAKSQTLSKSMLGPLVNISAILTRKLIPLTHSESKQPISHQGLDDVTTEAKTSLHVDFDGSSDSEDSGSDSSSSSYRANDWDEIQEDLATEVECLLVLDPIIRCPAPDIRRRRGDHGKEKMALDWQPHQSYSDKITNRFPDAAAELIDRLARANWERFLKTKTAREENTAAAEEDTKAAELTVVVAEAGVGVRPEHALTEPVSSKFNDSGVGTSIRTGSSYAETIMSYQAQGRESVRVPPLPEGAKQGKPFDCVACGRQLRITNNSAWKRHLYLDLCPWICHDVACKFGNQLFTSRQNWIEHLSLGHDFAPNWASFECPLCLRDTGQGKVAISTHLSSHMEEISLAALPVGADDDHTDDSDSEGAASPGSQAEAENSELFEVETQNQSLPYVSMTHGIVTHMNVDWTVDTGNLSRYHLITDSLVRRLGYDSGDFPRTDVKSISITGGTVHPIGSLYMTWKVSDAEAATASDGRAVSIFEVVSKNSLPVFLRSFDVIFSALAISSPKSDNSAAYIRQASRRDQIEALHTMAKVDTPEDNPGLRSLPWVQSSHHGWAVPGIADNGDAEMEEQARAPGSGRRFSSGEPRDDYASDMASDGSDPTEVPAKIGIEDIRNRHTTWGQFTCPYPDCHRYLRGLTRKDDLYRHLQQVHGPEPYPCPHTDCERHKNGLLSPITFCRHIDEVHERKPRAKHEFTCPYADCEHSKADNGFKLLNELVRHKRDTHGQLSIGKNYICRRGSCADRLRLWGRSDNLRLHLQRIHKLDLGPEHDLTDYIFNQDTDQAGDDIALYVCHHTPCTNKELTLYSEAASFQLHLTKVHKISLGDDGDLSEYIYHKGATLPMNHRERPSAAYMCPYEECEDRDLVWTDVRTFNEHIGLRHSQPVAETTSDVESPDPEAHDEKFMSTSRNNGGNRGDKPRTKDPMYSHPVVPPAPTTITHQSSSDESVSTSIGHTRPSANVHMAAGSPRPQMQIPPALVNQISDLEVRLRAKNPNISPDQARQLATEHVVGTMASQLHSAMNAAAGASGQHGIANKMPTITSQQQAAPHGIPSGMQAPPTPQGQRGSTGNPFTAIASKDWANPSFGPVPLDRPFQCDRCTQSFSRHHDLKRHKRIHMDISPFTCDGCQKGFSRKDALRRHKQVKSCGNEPKGEDAKAQNAQVTPAAEKKEIPPFEAIKNSAMHQLALGPRTQESVLDKLGCKDDEDFKKGFSAAAALESPGSQIWQLKQTLWTQLDVWAYKGYTSEERDQVIHNATIQYNLMRLSLTDPAWDLLLPEDERKRGEKPSDPQSGAEPPIQSSPEGSRKSLPEEAASRSRRKPRVREYRQTTNVKIAPKIARRDSSSDEDRGGPTGHGKQEEDVEQRDFDSVLQSLNPGFRARLMQSCNFKGIQLRSPEGEYDAKLYLLEQISEERLARARTEQGRMHDMSASGNSNMPAQQQYDEDGNAAMADYHMQLRILEEHRDEMRDKTARKRDSLAMPPDDVRPSLPPPFRRPGFATKSLSPGQECPFCGQSYSSYTELREHASTAHDASNLFPCTMCSFYFQTHDELRRHFSTHDPRALNYASSSEGYRYAAAADRPLHIPGSLLDNVPPPLPPPRFPTFPPSKQQECPVCNRSCSSSTELNRHAWLVHSVRELFPCETCPACFLTREELLSHVNTLHPSIEDNPSKRPHTKTRHGCKTCRRRRIRCDLQRPKCGYCIKCNIICEYLKEPAPDSSQQQQQQPQVPQLGASIADPAGGSSGIVHWSTSTSASSSEGYHDAGAPGRPPHLPSIRVSIPDEASDGDTSMKSLSPPPTLTGVVLPPPPPTASHQSFFGPEPPNPFARLPAINDALPSVLPPASPMESRPPMVGVNFVPEGPPNPFARPPPRVSVQDEPDSSQSRNNLTANTLVSDALSAQKGATPASADNNTQTPHGNPDHSYVGEHSQTQAHSSVQVTPSQPQGTGSPGSDQLGEI